VATAPNASDTDVRRFAERFAALAANVGQVIQGKPEAVRLALTCLFAEGHLLIEDVPGTGKTSLAKAIAGSIDGEWKRVQFTPDLLPSDVTGVSIYDENSREFEFHPGPVFANVVLGDEINRASPKTQAALLEVMQEHQVTVDGIAHPVPRPFIVMATQNPVEFDGTYQLPEAQRDRFLMRTQLGYPDLAAEVAIMGNEAAGPSIDRLQPVTTTAEVQELVAVARSVLIAPDLQQYIARLVAATREVPELLLGVSPRGSLALASAARSFAAADGRAYVLPEDVKTLAQPVLAHRMVLSAEAELQGRSTAELLGHVMASLDVPQGAGGAAAPAPIPAGVPAAPYGSNPPQAPAPAPAPAPVAAADALPEVTIHHQSGPATGKKPVR
jgi:MoxR-like ATPase